MTTDLLLAIDAGGTSVKLAVFDRDGNLVQRAAADVQTAHRANGWVEREAEAFWQATAEAIRALTHVVSADRIAAIACTGFGNGVFLVDEAGHPTRPGIVSVDHRAQPIVDEFLANGLALEIEAITGQRIWGGQTLLQLVWLARHEPEVVARSRWALLCKDFIRLRLTGIAATDTCDASGSGLMRLAEGRFDPALFRLVGIGDLAAKMPPVLHNSAIAGTITAEVAALTGLRPGTPVAAGMMDVGACVLGSGAVEQDTLTMIAGTWSINARLSDTPISGRPPILNTLHRDGDCRLVADGSPSSAGNLNWFVSRVMPAGTTFEAINDLVRSVDALDPRRCHFLPYVQGPLPRQGAFVGLTATDSLATMLLAIYEAIAFKHRWHAEVDAGYFGGRPPTAIRLAGGASKSAVWAHVFAEVCGAPVDVVQGEEIGALGAAMAASVAAGFHPTLREAAQRMSRVSNTFRPEPQRTAFYADRYAEFLELDRRSER